MRILLVQFLLASVLLSAVSVPAQTDSTISVEQIEQYSNQSKQLVKYLEGTLNFIGNPLELPSEKEIIYQQSYLKMFVNDEVQIEDDLDENREIPLNKDVQAYLKDIDFFYKEARFHFEIEKTEHLVTDSNMIVFKLTLNRHLEGVTVENDTISNNQLRYIELNLDPQQKDLKIASIYTTKVNKKEELRNWWNNMSSDWKNFFGKSVIVYDTLPLKNIIWFSDSTIIAKVWIDEIRIDSTELIDDGITDPPLWAHDTVFVEYDTISREITDTLMVNTSTIYHLLSTFSKVSVIDISNNLTLSNLSPLNEMENLESINISNTLIDDLTPLRNLKKLKILDCSGSSVTSLFALRYLTSLVEIDISNTQIEDIEVLSGFKELSKIYLSGSAVKTLDGLGDCLSLTHLEASQTIINNISPLSGLNMLSDLNISNSSIISLIGIDSVPNLQNLNIDSTNVIDIGPLGNCSNLSVLQANSTLVSDLSPLKDVKKLKVIYCDNSGVNMDEANGFMSKNPHCLVIYNSEELVNWWQGLSAEWRIIFSTSFKIDSPVTKEKLHILINQTSISVSYNKNIKNLEPLSMLHRLEELDIQNTRISDLRPISGLNNLELLNFSNTEVSTLEPLSSLNNLKTIKLENTSISDLSPLKAEKLEYVYCDKTQVDEPEAKRFKKQHPDCLVVYQSEKLKMWWNGLNAEWHSELQKPLELPPFPSKEELQSLINLTTLKVANNMDINDLSPLHVFTNLEELTINRTSVTDISPVLILTTIKKLNVSGNPISAIGEISNLTQLEELVISSTSIEDLEPLSGLSKLSSLDMSGTKIKSLKYTQGLSNLKKLYINNTRIKSLKPLYSLSGLKFLQCYNTSIKSSKLDDYRSAFPGVEVVYY